MTKLIYTVTFCTKNMTVACKKRLITTFYDGKRQCIEIYLTVMYDGHVSAAHTVPTLEKHGKID